MVRSPLFRLLLCCSYTKAEPLNSHNRTDMEEERRSKEYQLEEHTANSTEPLMGSSRCLRDMDDNSLEFNQVARPPKLLNIFGRIAPVTVLFIALVESLALLLLLTSSTSTATSSTSSILAATSSLEAVKFTKGVRPPIFGPECMCIAYIQSKIIK